MKCAIFGYAMQVLLFSTVAVDGFTTTVSNNCQCSRPSDRASALQYGFFDDWKSFFNGQNDDNQDDEDEAVAGETNIVTIPVKEIKPGGLRLFLMFYLMGLQNTPEDNSWRADQPTSEDYVVDFWYHDNSAVLSVTLSDEKKKITINRVGSQPSTKYIIQESLVVQGLLDELETMAKDPDVSVANRLLIPEEENTIEMARQSLAFG